MTTHILTAVLALAIGWCWGHRTARIRHVPIGATTAAPADDTQATTGGPAADVAGVRDRLTAAQPTAAELAAGLRRAFGSDDQAAQPRPHTRKAP